MKLLESKRGRGSFGELGLLSQVGNMDYELQQTSVIQSELNELDALALDKSHDLST